MHQIFIAKDAEQCKRYYTELQKKLTDAFKRLLDLEELEMWEGRPMVAEILDIEEVVDRIGYIYANPAKANLVETIEDYPGISTWHEFCNSNQLDSVHRRDVPWIRLPTIRKISSLELREVQDRFYTDELCERAKVSFPLLIMPNAWMQCFGINKESDVTNIINRIKQRIITKEKQARELRQKDGKNVLGASRLKKQGITWKHKPKKKERKIFVLSSIPELRIAFIKYMNLINDKARYAFKAVLQGNSPSWPPGIFRPPLPPIANTLGVD